MQIVDDRSGTLTTSTYSGTATVLNLSSSPFGDGWTLEGLEQITSASGGVILNSGMAGASLWFSGSFGSGGGTYTDPAGEFSTLVQNSGGGWTQTLTDGTQINFNSGGYETSVVQLDGLRTTFTYSSSKLTSIEDPYDNLVTFSYSGGYLQTIADPAGRTATFTNSGGALTQAELPDGSTWSYSANSGGAITLITDPDSNHLTITLRLRRTRRHNHPARLDDRGVQRRSRTGLDQQRHIQQPRHGHAAGSRRLDVHRPQRQRHDHPARLARPRHRRAGHRCARQRLDRGL